MKKFLGVIFVLFAIIAVVQMSMQKEQSKDEVKSTKPVVALSTFSLYDIARHIAGDTLDVFMIMPPGVDAHSFEPTPKLIVKIQKSALVIYSGAGLEPWIKRFQFTSHVINMSEYVKLRELKECAHEHTHGEHVSHESSLDPHYWLDIENMIKATQVITEAFIKILPQHKSLYYKNEASYIKMLKELDVEYKASLKSCKKETIIVNHDAFSYLAQRYGFHVEALSGLSPDAQPSAKNMAKLIEHVKEHGLKTVFFESFVSDKAIKSIANEAQVKVDVLYPLGNITKQQTNATYEELMKSNLQKISHAMECR